MRKRAHIKRREQQNKRKPRGEKQSTAHKTKAENIFYQTLGNTKSFYYTRSGKNILRNAWKYE